VARDWRAQPKQAAFLTAPEDEVFYGGAAGGGKTDGELMLGYRTCMALPGSRVLLLRRTFADLSKGGAAIDRSHELFGGIGKYNQQEHRWRFPNGSWLDFGHLQYEHTVTNYQGAQYDVVLWDELTQFTEYQYLYVLSRVRSPRGYPVKFRATGNPGGIGHGWVRKRFVDAAPWGDPFATTNDSGETAGSGRFIPAKLADNRQLLARDPGYANRLNALPYALRKALKDGDWDVFEGQVFVEWRRDTHVVRPFTIPASCRRRVGLDWGTNRPFVALWLAWGLRLQADPEPLAPCDGEHVYVYREFARRGLRDEQMADAVAARSKDEAIREHLADPNSFWLKNTQTGLNPAALFAARGVTLHPSNNARILGKRRVEQLLARCACGVPRLRVFETCPELIRTLPSLPYDKFDVEDVDTGAEDDAYDALRYGLMGPGAMPPAGESVTLSGMYA
jgi:hypothetical protein